MAKEPYFYVGLDEEGNLVQVTRAGQPVPIQELHELVPGKATIVWQYQLYDTTAGFQVLCRKDPITGKCWKLPS